MLSTLFALALMAAWLPLAAMVTYLLILAGAAARPQHTLPAAMTQRTFRIIIPAHDEALVLEPVLRRLRQMRYPGDHFQVVVVADNCTDATAAVAQSCGAQVLERFDSAALGKGHALAYAFDALRADDFDAYIILDADTLAGPELCAVFNRYLEQGQRIVQATYSVLDPWENRRTALMYVALQIFNYVRPLGRRRLGLSTGLKGNGMCFAKAVIDAHPWNAYSLAEDIEYTTTLLQHGERIAFAPEALVEAQMPVARAQATSQRVRWETGRLQMARRDGPRLVWSGLRRRDANLFDWGMDLVIPPLAALTLAVMAGGAIAGMAAVATHSPQLVWVARAWGALFAGLAVFIAVGMRVARLPHAAYQAMLSAPAYVVWKLWLYVRMAVQPRQQTWVRTDRTPLCEQSDRV